MEGVLSVALVELVMWLKLNIGEWGDSYVRKVPFTKLGVRALAYSPSSEEGASGRTSWRPRWSSLTTEF